MAQKHPIFSKESMGKNATPEYLSISSFKASIKDKLDIYKKFIRSHAEQSCTVCTGGLTKGNEKDLE